MRKGSINLCKAGRRRGEYRHFGGKTNRNNDAVNNSFRIFAGNIPIMERKLVIRNFGPFRSTSVLLKDFNFFIGEQGSGKSTLAKLITVFENHAATGRADLCRDLMAGFEALNIASYFNDDTYLGFHSARGVIEYRDGHFDCEVSEGGEPCDSSRTLYIPSERFFVSTFSRSLATLVLARVPIPDTLLEFASLYEKAKNKYPNYDVSILNLSYRADNMQETIMIDGCGKPIPFKDASSGIQSVIPLLMVLDYAREETSFGRCIVEEPELNLFPRTQVDLLHRMIACRPVLTVTTHSPYLLSAVNNLLEAGNVLKLHPEKKEEIVRLVPERCIMDFDRVAAYATENGEAVSILDEEYRLVAADKIDTVSDKESRIFSALLDLE